MSLMNMKQEELAITIKADGVNSVCFLGNLPLSECDTAVPSPTPSPSQTHRRPNVYTDLYHRTVFALQFYAYIYRAMPSPCPTAPNSPTP